MPKGRGIFSRQFPEQTGSLQSIEQPVLNGHRLLCSARTMQLDTGAGRSTTDRAALISCAKPVSSLETLKYGPGKQELEERKNGEPNQHVYL